MARKQSVRLDSVVARLGELPAIPEVVAEALRRIDDPAMDIQAVSEVIERDPALAAQILRLSNSAYYGLKRQVGTIKLAVVVLGMRELRNIILAASAYSAALDGHPENSVTYGLWRHSLMVAGLCKSMGAEMRLGLQGEDFVAGLLHDIGKLVLLSRVRSAYLPILREAQDRRQPVALLELDGFGFTHADVGAVLARRWLFPEPLVDALWMHHPQAAVKLDEADDPCLAALVRVANLAMADPTAEAAMDVEAWQVLEHAPAPIEPELRRVTLMQCREQLESSPAQP